MTNIVVIRTISENKIKMDQVVCKLLILYFYQVENVAFVITENEGVDRSQ